MWNRPCAGFSLIEVLVALLVTALGILGLVAELIVQILTKFFFSDFLHPYAPRPQW